MTTKEIRERWDNAKKHYGQILIDTDRGQTDYLLSLCESQQKALQEAKEIIASIDEDADIPWITKWESLTND